jgi:hypothetical protein
VSPAGERCADLGAVTATETTSLCRVILWRSSKRGSADMARWVGRMWRRLNGLRIGHNDLYVARFEL